MFHPGAYRTIADLEYATARWIDRHNNQLLHSTLDYTTLAEYQQAHYATTPENRNSYESGKDHRGASRLHR